MHARPILIRGQELTLNQIMIKYADEIPPGLTKKHISSRYFTHKWTVERAVFAPLTLHPKKDLGQKKREQAERDKRKREKRKKLAQETDQLYVYVMNAIKPLETNHANRKTNQID